MPTTYAHDAFGKIVYQKLPEEMKQIIGNERTAYLIGLHGPDILFYNRPFCKNPISQKGHEMHEELASVFFSACKKKYMEEESEILLAYMFGFVCHYMLDSTCHPYINEYIEKTGVSHDEIETEFDRELMERNNRNPFRFHPSDSVHLEKETIREIANAMSDLSECQVRHCLKAMKFYTNITVCSNCFKRNFLLNMARFTKASDAIQGRIIKKKKSKRCEESNQMLLHLFRLAVPETVTVMEDFYNTITDMDYLNYRFERNYK